MSKKSPAFQLYVDDLLGSGTVQAASTEEVGAYVLLLCYDWQEMGFVYDEQRLANVCHLSVPRFRKAWAHLEAKFPERGGRRYNPRLEKERAKQAKWMAQASDKGKKGATVRWLGQSTPRPDDTPGIVPPDASGIPQAMPGTMPGDGFPVSLLPEVTTTTAAEAARANADERTPERRASDQQRQDFADCMGAVRTHAYLGSTPTAHDGKIVREWLQRGRSAAEIISALEGLRLAVDRGEVEFIGAGAKFTCRALINTRWDGRPTWDLALKALESAPEVKREGALTPVGELLAKREEKVA